MAAKLLFAHFPSLPASIHRQPCGKIPFVIHCAYYCCQRFVRQCSSSPMYQRIIIVSHLITAQGAAQAGVIQRYDACTGTRIRTDDRVTVLDISIILRHSAVLIPVAKDAGDILLPPDQCFRIVAAAVDIQHDICGRSADWTAVLAACRIC